MNVWAAYAARQCNEHQMIKVLTHIAFGSCSVLTQYCLLIVQKAAHCSSESNSIEKTAVGNSNRISHMMTSLE